MDRLPKKIADVQAQGAESREAGKALLFLLLRYGMNDLVAFAGHLTGAMIDPLTWIAAITAVWFFRAKSVWTAILMATAMNFGVDLLVLLQFGNPSPVPTLFFAVVATAVWTGVFYALKCLYWANKLR